MYDSRKRSDPPEVEELRSELRRRGRQLTRSDIAWLKSGNYLNGEWPTDLLADIVEEQRRYVSDNQVPTLQRGDREAWLLAKSALVAYTARDEATRVQSFRSAHLDETTVPADLIAAWIRSTAKAEGPARMVYEVDFGSEVEAGGPREYGSPADVPLTRRSATVKAARWLSLDYAYRQEGEWRRGSVRVVPGGVLDELRVLAGVLARDYRWDEAAATALVLADVVPMVPTIRGAYSSAGYLTLTIDVELTAVEVAAFYSDQRSSVVGPRVRPVKAANADLARFVAERRGMTWGNLFAEWRRRPGARSFPSESGFRQAATRAQDRILNGPRR